LEAQQAMEQDHAVVNKLSCYVIRNEDGTYRNDYTMHPVENTQPITNIISCKKIKDE
jgi:hypothetical protein